MMHIYIIVLWSWYAHYVQKNGSRDPRWGLGTRLNAICIDLEHRIFGGGWSQFLWNARLIIAHNTG